MLSVSGARGIVGATMTPAIATRFAAAFGTFLKQATGDSRPVICLGRDSRPSGEMVSLAAAAGLVGVGCDVIRLGIVTTPTVGVMIDQHRATGGMVVTASHNPIQWNGIKCLNNFGVAPPADDAATTIDIFKNDNQDWVDVHALGSLSDDASANEVHVQRVLQHVDVDLIQAANLRVVLDSVNGAGCVAGKMLLEKLGVEVVHLNGDPTGIFAHTPEPIAENLTDLCQAVKDHADISCGFAQDPDADRLAIVDENGQFIGEEYTLVLCTKETLNNYDSQASKLLATNLSTSRMIDDVASDFSNTTVVRTAVGEANVVAAMIPHESRAVIGGEGNGGVIFPKVCWVRDSLSAMALTLSLLAREKTAVSQIVDRLPAYITIKKKYDLQDIGGLAAVTEMIEYIKTTFANERLDDADGVRVDFEDGWAHLRPSNTEPIMRLIVEAQTTERANQIIHMITTATNLGR